MAILLVEQYYDFARSLADQYLVMERGEIIMRGRGDDMEKDGVLAALAVQRCGRWLAARHAAADGTVRQCRHSHAGRRRERSDAGGGEPITRPV